MKVFFSVSLIVLVKPRRRSGRDLRPIRCRPSAAAVREDRQERGQLLSRESYRENMKGHRADLHDKIAEESDAAVVCDRGDRLTQSARWPRGSDGMGLTGGALGKLNQADHVGRLGQAGRDEPERRALLVGRHPAVAVVD